MEDVDRIIAASLGPHLARNGIRIAGLDVIGGRLIEVNTANPGGLHHAARLAEVDEADPDRLSRTVVRRLTAPSPAPAGT